MKDSLSTVFDSFLLFAIIFLFSLTGLRFSCKYPLSVILAALLGGIAAFVFYWHRHKKCGKLCMGKRENAFAEKCFSALSKMPYTDAENFLKILYEKQLNEKLSPRRANGKTVYFSEGGTIFAFFPEYFPIKAERLMELLRNNPTIRPLSIVACAYAEGTQTVADAFGAKLLDPKEVFSAMKTQQLFPPFPKEEEKKRFQVRKYFRVLFTRKRSKRFFVLGAWMTVFSLFIPFPTYYLISGGIFLFLSAFCLLFGVKT